MCIALVNIFFKSSGLIIWRLLCILCHVVRANFSAWSRLRHRNALTGKAWRNVIQHWLVCNRLCGNLRWVRANFGMFHAFSLKGNVIYKNESKIEPDRGLSCRLVSKSILPITHSALAGTAGDRWVHICKASWQYIKKQQVHSDKPVSGAGSPSCRPGSVQ